MNIFTSKKQLKLQTRCQRCASRLAQRHSDMVKMFFPSRTLRTFLLATLQITNSMFDIVKIPVLLNSIHATHHNIVK